MIPSPPCGEVARSAGGGAKQFANHRARINLLPTVPGGGAKRRGGEQLVLSGGVQLLQEPVQIPQPLRPGRVLQRLVLGKDVDEPLPQVVAVAKDGVAAPVAQTVDDLPHLALWTEREVSHQAPVAAPAS